jgi:hypothetical protein
LAPPYKVAFMADDVEKSAAKTMIVKPKEPANGWAAAAKA